MNNGKLHKIIIAIMSLLLILNFINTLSIKKRLNDIENGLSRATRDYASQINDLENLTRNRLNDIQEHIEESSSLFNHKNVDIKLMKDSLIIKVDCQPKKLNTNEDILVKISTEKDTYQKEMIFNKTENIYETSFEIPLSKEIKTDVIIKTSDYTINENLSKDYLDSFLSMDISSDWNPNKDVHSTEDILYVYLGKDREYLPFSKRDIKQSYFIISDDYNFSLDNLSKNELKHIISGHSGNHYIVNGEKAPESSDLGDDLLITGDLSHYANLKDDIEYEVFLIIETKNNQLFVTKDNSLASFSSSDNGSGKSSGSNTLTGIIE